MLYLSLKAMLQDHVLWSSRRYSNCSIWRNSDCHMYGFVLNSLDIMSRLILHHSFILNQLVLLAIGSKSVPSTNVPNYFSTSLTSLPFTYVTTWQHTGKIVIHRSFLAIYVLENFIPYMDKSQLNINETYKESSNKNTKKRLRMETKTEAAEKDRNVLSTTQ